MTIGTSSKVKFKFGVLVTKTEEPEENCRRADWPKTHKHKQNKTNH